jgi:hypothetical protein
MSMDPRVAAVMSGIKTPLKSEKGMLLFGEVVDISDGESGAGRPQTTVRIAPIVNDYPQQDLAMSLYVQRPMDDDDPATLGKIRAKGGAFLRTCDPEFPKAPRKVSKGVYETQDGATISGPAVDRAFAADRLAVFSGLQRLADDEDYLKSFVGKRLFFSPQKAKINPPGSDYSGISQFIGFVTAEARDGDVVNTTDVVDQDTLHEAVAQALAEMEE